MEFRLQHLIIFLAFTTFATCRVIDTKGMDGEFYCRGRNQRELFRRKLSENATYEDYRKQCNVFYQCVAIHGGKKDISGNQCPQSMSFDVDIQTCQLHSKVNNCDQWEKFRPPVPRWPIPEGEESNCPDNQIECGSGECLGRELFCDDIADCSDGSDENACGPDTDPNAAPKCNPAVCADGSCFCSVDGTRIPGKLSPEETPQMILITFSGAINERNFGMFDELFSGSIKHKGNDCTVKATFFVSHAYTNYSAVQELHRRGHEIATHSITNKQDSSYWTNLPYEQYFEEFHGNRAIIEKYANITDYSIIGVRVPHGRVGGNPQFKMMTDSSFMYDSSISAPRGRLPLWPYDLSFRMPHKCLGTDQNCPSRNFTVYEMVMNELDRRDDPSHDEKLTGCFYVDQCTNINTETQFQNFLDNNLAHHFNTNRAPFGLHFTAPYFETRPKFLRILKNWIRDVSQRGSYYFVTNQQAIVWMENPTLVTNIPNFDGWKEKCEVQGLPYCSLPNPCPMRAPRLFPHEESMYLYTCADCPKSYPWLGNIYDDNFGNFL